MKFKQLHFYIVPGVEEFGGHSFVAPFSLEVIAGALQLGTQLLLYFGVGINELKYFLCCVIIKKKAMAVNMDGK